MFQPGDKVRNKNTGNAYTIKEVRDVFGVPYLIMVGYGDTPVPASAHELLEPRDLVEFKRAVAKARDAGYDVKATISRTVTEEL